MRLTFRLMCEEQNPGYSIKSHKSITSRQWKWKKLMFPLKREQLIFFLIFLHWMFCIYFFCNCIRNLLLNTFCIWCFVRDMFRNDMFVGDMFRDDLFCDDMFCQKYVLWNVLSEICFVMIYFVGDMFRDGMSYRRHVTWYV